MHLQLSKITSLWRNLETCHAWLFHNNSNPTDLTEILELVDLKMLPLMYIHSGSSLHYDLINRFDVFLKYHGDVIWSRAICFAFVYVCDCAQPVWPHQSFQSLSQAVFVCVWAEQVHRDIKLSPSQLLLCATESSSLRDTADVTNFYHFEPGKEEVSYQLNARSAAQGSVFKQATMPCQDDNSWYKTHL